MKSLRTENKILCIIPARGGSKRLPGKNIKLLAGKPLITYSIEQANESGYIEKTIVSTEDAAIYKAAEKLGVELHRRPKQLSGDKITTLAVLKHILIEIADKYKPEYVVLLQPTSPLRRVEHIDKAIQMAISRKADVVVSVKKATEPIEWMFNIDSKSILRKYSPHHIGRKQDTQDLRILNGAVYVFSTNYLLKHDDIFSGVIYGFEMDKVSSIDIDDVVDFKIAEFLMKNERN